MDELRTALWTRCARPDILLFALAACELRAELLRYRDKSTICESSSRVTASTVARLETSGQTAHRIADLVTESFAADEVAVDLWNAGDARWRVGNSFPRRARPGRGAGAGRAAAGAEAAKALVFERIAARDWVRESLRGLKPVAAGRFVVHGAHDRARVPANRIGIEIEAALAFGTGHHGTTRGCLLALDGICKSIAPAHTRPRSRRCARDSRCRHRHRRARRSPPRARCGGRVLATDIDPVAVRAARGNARLNRAGNDDRGGAGGRRRRADDPRARAVRLSSSPTSCSGRSAPGRAAAETRSRPARRVVLSGLLPAQANAALAAYRALRARTAHRPRRLDHAGAGAPRAPRAAPLPAAAPAPRLPPMFEAHFQSFDDRSDRGASAPRVAALRAELARRGLDGFIVPRADRFQNEYVPPCDERLAWLTGFTGSAGDRDRACRPRRAVRRRPLHGAGARGSRRRDLLDRASGRASAARHGSRPICRPAPSSAIRPVAAHHRRRRAARQSLRGSAARALVRRRRQSDRCDLDRPAAAAARRRWCCTTCAMPARAPQHKLARVRAEIAKASSRRARGHRSARGRPGCSTSAAATCRIRRCVLAFALVPHEGRPTLYVDGRKLGNDVRARLEELADVRASAEFERDLAALGSERRKPCGSILGHRRRRSRASSPRAAARCCAAATRSRR